jgi:hypothetical protein
MMVLNAQLTLPFLPAADPPPARLSAYRGRLRAVAERAYRLGMIRARKRAIIFAPAFEGGKHVVKPRSLSAATVPKSDFKAVKIILPLPTLDRSDRNELLLLARKIDRLSISRVDPEKFFADRSELAAELRRLARRY